jgi:hypothetical protein
MSYTGSVHIDGIKPVSFVLIGSDLTAPYLATRINKNFDNSAQLAVA